MPRRRKAVVLNKHKAKQVLRAYGLPVPEIRVVKDEAAVEAAATDVLACRCTGGEAALADDRRIQRGRRGARSADASGGVHRPARTIREKLAARSAGSGARQFHPADGEDEGGEENAGGPFDNPTSGPIVLFGAGGTAVEVVDTAAGIHRRSAGRRLIKPGFRSCSPAIVMGSRRTGRRSSARCWGCRNWRWISGDRGRRYRCW